MLKGILTVLVSATDVQMTMYSPTSQLEHTLSGMQMSLSNALINIPLYPTICVSSNGVV